MIVNCNKCGAKFQLADEKVTEKGVKVRCSKCKVVFTVKSPSDDAGTPPEPAAPKPPTPPAPPSPAKPSSGGGTGDDPFADFNFSDDLDFGPDNEDDLGMDDKAPDSPVNDGTPPLPPPAKVSSSFMDDSPGAPVTDDDDDFGSFDDDLDDGDDSAADDDNFDFNDEEFSLSDGPGQSKEQPPPPSDDDGDDFHFDDDSFSEPAASPGPDPPPKPDQGGDSDDGDWGNVSFTEGGGGDSGAGVSDDQLGEEIDEEGFGDFQFDSDDSLPSGDDDSVMEVDDFVRSPKQSSSSSDNLEASIGDDYEPDRREEEHTDTMAPPPPKPVKKSGPKQKGGKLWMAVLVPVLIIGSFVGLIFYTGSQGWFTFGDLFRGDFEKIKDIPAVTDYLIANGYMEEPEKGAVNIKGKTSVNMVTREDESVIIVVEGNIVNGSNKDQSNIKVEVGLKNKETNEILSTSHSYCDVSFSMDDLKTMERETIEALMNAAGGRNQDCNQVAPGVTMPFTVVFFDFPDISLGVTKPKVVEYKRSGAVDLQH